MKKLSNPLIIILSLALAIAPFFYLHSSYDKLKIQSVFAHGEEEEEEGAGGAMEDDPMARLKWEWMRTRDPQTGKIPDNIRALELAFAKGIPTFEEVYGTKMAKGPSGWISRGPNNVGGRTRAIALDVTNESIIMAGAASGGVWRSLDSGKTWKQCTTPGQLKTITCIAQDTRSGKQNIWYAGTGEAYGGFIVAGDGYFKSTDSGKTWQLLQSVNKPQNFSFLQYVWNIAINPANTTKDEVYIAAYGGIFKSTSGGDTIKPVLAGVNNVFSAYANFTDVAVTSTGIIYATLSSNGYNGKIGIFRSTDGINWVNITPKTFPTSYQRIKIGIAPSNENVVYFLASTPGSGFAGVGWDGKKDYNSFYKYTYLKGDGKYTNGIWEDRSNALPDFHHTHPWIMGDFSSQQGYDMVVKVKPDNENVVFIGGTNLYRSDNGFADRTKTYWIGGYNHATDINQNYTYTNHHPDQHNLIFLSSNYNTVFSSCDGGVFRSDNALDTLVKWTPLNQGYITTQFYSIALNQNAKLGHPYSDILLGGLQDNNSWLTQVSAAPDKAWEPWYRGDGGFCAVNDNDTATFMFTSLQLGKMRMDIFDKTGKNLGWARIDPIGAKNYLFIAPFVLDNTNHNTMYLAGGEYVWRNDSLYSIPLAANKDSISTGWKQLVPTRRVGNYVTALASAPAPYHILYYGTYTGDLFRVDHPENDSLLKVTNITGSLFSGSSYLNCIAVDPQDGNKLMAVCSNYGVRSVFYSADGGKSWKDVSANLEEKPNGSGNGPSCRSAKIMYGPDGKPYYFVGASTGLYMSRNIDSNVLWVQIGANTIGNMDVEMIDGRMTDGLMAAATYGAGVFTASIGDVIGIDKNKPIAHGFLISSIFPNPAENSCNVTLRMETPAKGAIELLDIQGRLIQNIPNTYYHSGDNEIPLNLSGLPKGIYICKVIINGFTDTKKILKI